MNLSTSILGTTAVEQLQKTARAAVVEFGSDKLTRADLARVGCYNFMAAKNLSARVNAAVTVKSLKQLYDEVPWTALALPRVGTVSLAVLGACFEAKGIGGEEPLEAYVKKHNEPDQALVTWTTLKHHEEQEQAQARKAAKKRKAQRRDQAHKIRTERFEARQASQ